MRWILTTLTLASLSSSSSGREPAEAERAMDEIEGAVTLPAGALPLQKYARYYSEDSGKIIGAYTTKIEQRAPDYGCSKMTEVFKLIDVSCSAIADLAPGQRRWVKHDDIPAVSGADCNAVQMVYKPHEKSFEFIDCVEPMH